MTNHQAMRVVIASRIYDTTLEDLWDALTNRERISRWFLPISGDLRVGGRYQFADNACGTITRCEAPRVVAVTWELGGTVSSVTVSLESDPHGGTRLELEHVAPASDHWKQFGPRAVGIGWDDGLAALADHIARGRAAPDRSTAARTEWPVRPEGYRDARARLGVSR